jgi:putative FmdB family regulatory protein
MPLYEYECDSCGHRFEVIQKFSDPPIEKCPKCGSTVHKLMSSPAIQFKGSGWYITDYAKKDSTSATKAGAAKEGSTTTDSSTPSTDKSTPAPASPASPATTKPE